MPDHSQLLRLLQALSVIQGGTYEVAVEPTLDPESVNVTWGAAAYLVNIECAFLSLNNSTNQTSALRVAQALESAHPRKLLVLDERGRGAGNSLVKLHTCHFCSSLFSMLKPYRRLPNVLACLDCIDRQLGFINPEFKYGDLDQKVQYFLNSMQGLKKAGLPYNYYETQGGVCAVCSATKPGGKGAWILDHNHLCQHPKRSSKQGCPNCVRGILCLQCNMMLGASRDNPFILQRAIEYLSK